MASTSSLAARARARPRTFYVGLSLLMAAIAVIGFLPSYLGPLFAGSLDSKLILHIHGAVFASWLLLLIAQVSWVAVGRTDLHRRFGRLGIVWGAVLLFVGVVTSIVRFADRIDAGDFAEAQAFVIWPLIDMLIFAGVFAAAVHYRRQPQHHKRLMVVAATNLLVAPVSRWLAVEPTPAGALFLGDDALGHLTFIGVWTTPILLAMIYDARRERTVHPIYLGGIALLAVSSFRDLLVPTAPWHAITVWLATVAA